MSAVSCLFLWGCLFLLGCLFFLLICKSFIYIRDMSPWRGRCVCECVCVCVYTYIYCKYLLPLCKLPFRSLSGVFWTHVLNFYFGWCVGRCVWLGQLLRNWDLRTTEFHSSFEHFHIHNWGGNCWFFSSFTAYNCKIFKLYNVMVWYTYVYVLWKDTPVELTQMFLILMQTNLSPFSFMVNFLRPL